MSPHASNEARVIPLRPAAAPPVGPPAKEPLWRDLVGDVLRRERLAQERTLKDVADAARISMPYLSEVERGRKEASSELLSAICGALDVPLSRVLADAGEEMERAELASVAHVSAANIDATTKVVIPHVVSMAVA